MNQPLPDFLSTIDNAAHEMIERLLAWANHNSGSENTPGLIAMGEMIEAAIGEFGVEVRRLPIGDDGRFALCARKEVAGRTRVLLSGHFDTVYGPTDSFQTCETVADDRIRGPGVADMKGGIVLMLMALRALESSTEAKELGWEILLSPDEETGSLLSAPLLREAARQNDIGIVFEASLPDGSIVASRKGGGAFTAEARGVAAHAGRDFSAGRNAIVALSRFVSAADALNREIPDIVINTGSVAGGGAVNIVPDRAVAEFNIRADRAADGDEAVRRLHQLAHEVGGENEVQITVTGEFSRPPMEASPGKRKLLDAWCACGMATGVDFGYGHTGGGSDANILTAAGLACIDGAGVEGGELHSDREWMRPSSLPRRAKIAALFLHRLATGVIEI